MGLFLRNKSHIVDSRIIPFHAIEVYGGAGEDDLHFIIRSIGQSSVWGITPLYRDGDTNDKRIIAYNITAVGDCIYNDWGDGDFAKQFELLSFNKVVDCNLWLQANNAQPGRGTMYISMKASTIRDWFVKWSIPEQNNAKMPKLRIELNGMFSIDGVKGFSDRYDLDDTEKHFFS